MQACGETKTTKLAVVRRGSEFASARRLNLEKKEKGRDRKDAAHYVLFFYWDPKDKRVLVPKRWGYGWTINFANPVSIAVVLALIASTILLPKLL